MEEKSEVVLFSSRKALRSARMTRAKKQLSKRNDIGPGDLRKSVHFQGPFPGQSDFHSQEKRTFQRLMTTTTTQYLKTCVQ